MNITASSINKNNYPLFGGLVLKNPQDIPPQILDEIKNHKELKKITEELESCNKDLTLNYERQRIYLWVENKEADQNGIIAHYLDSFDQNELYFIDSVDIMHSYKCTSSLNNSGHAKQNKKAWWSLF